MDSHKRRCPRGKLHCHDWLGDLPGVPGIEDTAADLVEVQFKNTRKGYYRNSLGLDIAVGDMVAVESSPGHDIGCVTLTGRLVPLQMRRAGIKDPAGADLRRIFRKAKEADLEKYEEARARENDTMIRARKIAESLQLNMKIGDVEYQGDGNKAIFYYIADERVDFRQLIKVLADTFKVRIEMKQIGARQEAGRIGGIGSCGRPLCCASWMSNFISVGTSAARYQDISLNPQKLAGQCAKLKCCLNFEVDTYVESAKFLPEKNIRLETADSTWYHFKTDIFKKEITYSSDKQMAANLVTIDAERAFEVIELNRKGEKPLRLEREGQPKAGEKPKPIDLASQDDLTRFDKAKKKKAKKKPSGNDKQPRAAKKADSTQDGGDNPEAQTPGNDGQPGNARREGRGDKPQRGDRQQRPARPPKGDKPQAAPKAQQPGEQQPKTKGGNAPSKPKGNNREGRDRSKGGSNPGSPRAEAPQGQPAPVQQGRIPKAFRDTGTPAVGE